MTTLIGVIWKACYYDWALIQIGLTYWCSVSQLSTTMSELMAIWLDQSTRNKDSAKAALFRLTYSIFAHKVYPHWLTRLWEEALCMGWEFVVAHWEEALSPIVSHLLFADDSFFCFRASRGECEEIKKILTDYENASGQAINFNKSGIFFSKNVDACLQHDISFLLGISHALDTGRYLGLPSLIGSKTKVVFSYLRDRIWSWIQTWGGNSLSKAGTEVMLKSVAHALPRNQWLMHYPLTVWIALCFLHHSSMNSRKWWIRSGGVLNQIYLEWDQVDALGQIVYS